MPRTKPKRAPTHREIIERAGGPAAVGRKIAVEANTTKAWKRLDSIPAPHWHAISSAGIASLMELAEAAAAKIDRSSNSQVAA